VLDTLSNAEYNIKYLKQKNKQKITVYNILQEHVNEYAFMYRYQFMYQENKLTYSVEKELSEFSFVDMEYRCKR